MKGSDQTVRDRWRTALGLSALAWMAVLGPAMKLVAFNQGYFLLSMADIALLSAALALPFALVIIACTWIGPLAGLVETGVKALFCQSVLFAFMLPAALVPLDGGNGVMFEIRQEAHRATWVVVVSVPLLALASAAWPSLGARVSSGLRVLAWICVMYVVGFSAYGLASGRLPAWLEPRDFGDPAAWTVVSGERNIFILSFDQVQGGFLADELASGRVPADAFRGFVLYRDAASTYPSTEYSLASTLLGRVVRSGAELSGMAAKDPASLLARARRAGYRVATTAAFHGEGLECVLCDESRRIQARPKRKELLVHAVNLAYGMDLDRVPLLGPVVATSSGTHRSIAWKMDLGGLAASFSGLRTGGGQPKLYFTHFYGSHQPFSYTSDCRPVPAGEVASRQGLAGARSSLDCVVAVVSAFLGRLQALGVYDRSMVFVLSDHGYERDVNRALGPAVSSVGDPRNIRPVGAYNPVLMFKDFSSRGPLRTSSEPASLLDVAATVCGRLPGCDGPLEGLDLARPLPTDRQRRFHLYLGGADRRTAGGLDKYHFGFDTYWELRSFRGPLHPAMAEAMRAGQPP